MNKLNAYSASSSENEDGSEDKQKVAEQVEYET